MSLERHDAQTVAQLIYVSAPEMFQLLFGGLLFGQAAVEIIQKLVTHHHNHLSHRYVQVAESDDQVVGIATLVPAIELNDETDYDSVLNFWARLRWQIAHRLILDRVLQHTYPADSFYIANLAVTPAYRGKGIGTQLLQHCIANATAAGANRIFISVDINNPRAQKLYESIGFQVIATKTVSLLKMTIGSRVLARSL
jgi:ribosomal protein S18 acetylase RimI-like enzyme